MTIISNVDGPETTSPVTTVTFVAAFVRMNFETLISNLSGARKPPLIIAAVIAALKRGERTDLSPRWGFAMFSLFPRLAQWAAFFRRFAAKSGYQSIFFDLKP